MSKENFNPEIDRLIDKASQVSGTGRDKIDSAIRSNPQIASLLSKLSPSDINRLQSVLNDKSKTAQLLSSPQAQALLRSMKNGGKKDK